MEIKVAGCIGFCFGVKRAIRIAKSGLEKERFIYSIGPIIHNPQMVSDLSKDGLKATRDLNSIKEGTVLIPSHGIGPALIKEAYQMGLRLIDATCPFVKKSQELVKILSRDSYKILIVGEGSHPEVKALVDYSEGKAEVIGSEEKAKTLDLKGMKVSVIAQTTQSQRYYLKIVSLLLDKGHKELRVFNTICHETIKRQEAVRRLASGVELMLVIGGKNSANTSRLVKICKDAGLEVYHIEDSSELKPEWFIDKSSVGVSSGASTPDWIVESVVDRLKKFKIQNSKVKVTI